MRTQAIYLAFQLAITLVLYFWLSFPLGYTALAIFVGWPVIGTIVTADDDLPGGWSNPDGTYPPLWETTKFWGLLLIRFNIAMMAFVIEVGFWSPRSTVYWVLAAISGIAAFVLLKKANSVRT